jgi:hypothetical protein
VVFQEDLLERIQRCFRREYSTMMLLHGTLLDQILDYVQVMRLAVHSYPYFPNALALTIALAKQTGWSAGRAVY